MSIAMNVYQRAVAKTYGQGDFAHVADLVDWRAELDELGDSLFKFLMIELSTSEGCNSQAEALNRLRIATRDLEQAAADVAAT